MHVKPHWIDAESQGQLPIFDVLYGRCEPEALILTGIENKGNPDLARIRPYQPFKVKDRQEMIPYLFEHLWNQTKYLCFQTFTESPLVGNQLDLYREKNVSDPACPGWTYFAKKDEHIKELVSVTMDLDSYKRGLDSSIALGIVLSRAEQGLIPFPTLFARSGRGSYLLWLLRDETGSPPPCTEQNLDLYRVVGREIHSRLEDLEADAISLIPSQWFKAPGTVDTKTGRRVYFAAFGVGELAKIPLYSLDQLKTELGLYLSDVDHLPRRAVSVSDWKKPHKSRAGQGGQRWRKCVREIEMLNIFRKGIKKGHRERTLFYFHQAFLAHKKTVERAGVYDHESVKNIDRYCREEALKEVLRLNATFDPPLPRKEALHAAKKSLPLLKKARMYAPRRETVSRHLGVTESEARELGLEHLLPPRWIEKQRNEKARQRALKKAVRQAVDLELKKGRRDYQKIAWKVELETGVSISRQRVYSRRKSLVKGGKIPKETPLFASRSRRDSSSCGSET